MTSWTVQIPADNLNERYVTIADCKTKEAFIALVSSLLDELTNGPTQVKIQRWTQNDPGK